VNEVTIKSAEEDEEIHRLRQINVEEWSLVDNPAIEETWLILKRVEEMNKMSDELEKAKKAEEDEEAKKKKKEAEEEEMKKASVKEAAAQAAKLLENATGGTDNEKKRLTLLIGNLKSLAGVKKADEDEDDDVKKAGRSISKETSSAIDGVTDLLKQAVGLLDKIGKPKADDEEYGYPKPKVKKVDESAINDGLKEVLALYKQGLVEDSEITELLNQFEGGA